MVLVKQHPKVVVYGFSLSMMQTALGRVYRARGDWKEARVPLEAANDRLFALYEKNKDLNSVRSFLSMNSSELIDVLKNLGEPEKAKAVEIQKS